MLLKKGYLFKNRHESNEREEFTMRLISTESLEKVVDLEDKIYEGLPNKEILFVDSYEDIYNDLLIGAKIIGVFNSLNELIAYRYVSFPKMDRRNLGCDIKLPINELDRVCQLETTVVDPPYRGNNLQSITLGLMIPIVKAEGYKHLVCTISPLNYHSVNNIMKHGLKVKDLKKKYATDGNDGIWRYILHGTTSDSSYGKIIDTVNSNMDDLEKQISLMENGYIGYELVSKNQTLNYVKFE